MAAGHAPNGCQKAIFKIFLAIFRCKYGSSPLFICGNCYDFLLLFLKITSMKFQDFHPNQIIEAGPYVLTEAELLDFAQAWDPQWFHTDPAAAAAGPHGGLIASGWQTCGIAMRLAVQAVLHDSESFASPGLSYLKWTNPVRAGDALRLKATVLDTRTSASKPDLGILRWRWQLFNQHDAQVLDMEATSLFKLPV
jgi:acyl dehydratase